MSALRVEAASDGDLQIDRDADRSWRRRPVRFGWGRTMRNAVEVLDRWPSEDKCDFRVLADDGATYILRHHEAEDRWQLLFFERGPSS